VPNDIEGCAPRRAAGADLLSYCNNASLRKAARRLGKLYDGVLEPSGLKATQCILLTQIYDLGSPTMAELANSLLMDLSATRHSLGPLIRDRTVRLRVDPKDHRVKRATLTPTGVAKFKEANQLVLSTRSARRARPLRLFRRWPAKFVTCLAGVSHSTRGTQS
jgi:DNA-binding MarR family transcriptional regulator